MKKILFVCHGNICRSTIRRASAICCLRMLVRRVRWLILGIPARVWPSRPACGPMSRGSCRLSYSLFLSTGIMRCSSANKGKGNAGPKPFNLWFRPGVLCYNIRGAITQEAVSPLRRDCDPPMT